MCEESVGAEMTEDGRWVVGTIFTCVCEGGTPNRVTLHPIEEQITGGGNPVNLEAECTAAGTYTVTVGSTSHLGIESISCNQ